MKQSKAFAPANISCIFKIHTKKNPRWTGSYGLGFTVNEGVFVKAEFSDKNLILFNGKKINFPTVQYVIDKLNKEYYKKIKNKEQNDSKIKIEIKTSLPLGCGFGLSGASALATAYALNKFLNLKKSKKELAILAHTAEVINKTGLGDVVNQYYGGFCLKLNPSSHFIIKKLPIDNVDVYCRYFSKIYTKNIITDKELKKSINKSATASLNKVQLLIKNSKNKKFPSEIFSSIIKVSKEFSVNSGLLKDSKAINAINKIEKNKGNASMIMLGNAVFSDRSFEGAMKLRIEDRRAFLL